MDKKAIDLLRAALFGAAATGLGAVAPAASHIFGHNAYKKKMHEGAADFSTTSNDDRYKGGSWASTFNPLSGVTGGIDKIPSKWVNLFPDTEKGKQMAHMTFKAGAVSLLAAALAGGYRAAKHYTDMDELAEADRPGKDLAGQLSTTFEGSMLPEDKRKKQKKMAAEADPGRIAEPDTISWNNFIRTAVPLGATLLAASVAASATDNYFDKRRNKALDKAIADKENAIKQLVATRARMAKGYGTRKELSEATQDLGDKDIYVKDASLNKEAADPISFSALVQHLGTATAAVILASAIGSYAYTSAADENNIKFKAYRKALREYAKNKSGITPITINPTDQQAYFDYINGTTADKKKLSAREQPELNTDELNKPISISI